MRYDDITKLNNELIAEACEDAADMLEGHWIQGAWFQSNYDDETQDTETWGYCLEGGLAAALGLENIEEAEDTARFELMSCPVYNAVLETLNHQVFQQRMDAGYLEADAEYLPSYGEGDLPNWNDSEERSEQEVVDLLRATAKRVLMPDE